MFPVSPALQADSLNVEPSGNCLHDVRGTLNKDSTLFHLNEEFERIERRDKKASLSEQCKEIEENNRMGNIRDDFKKIRATKATFHAKMDTIKDRNGMDLTEAEDIKERWQ